MSAVSSAQQRSGPPSARLVNVKLRVRHSVGVGLGDAADRSIQTPASRWFLRVGRTTRQNPAAQQRSGRRSPSKKRKNTA
jgi:hypothetical protein